MVSVKVKDPKFSSGARAPSTAAPACLASWPTVPSVNPSKFAELYIVEGESAPAARPNRAATAKFQAILPLKGKILNVEKARFDKMLSSRGDQDADLGPRARASAQDDFDIDKLRYHKLIIMCDADVDGSHIRTLMLTFFYRQMEGDRRAEAHLYIAQPPLYKVNEGRKKRPTSRTTASTTSSGRADPGRTGELSLGTNGERERLKALGLSPRSRAGHSSFAYQPGRLAIARLSDRCAARGPGSTGVSPAIPGSGDPNGWRDRRDHRGLGIPLKCAGGGRGATGATGFVIVRQPPRRCRAATCGSIADLVEQIAEFRSMADATRSAWRRWVDRDAYRSVSRRRRRQAERRGSTPSDEADRQRSGPGRQEADSIQRYKGLGEMNAGAAVGDHDGPRARRCSGDGIEDDAFRRRHLLDPDGRQVEPRREFIEIERAQCRPTWTTAVGRRPSADESGRWTQ